MVSYNQQYTTYYKRAINLSLKPELVLIIWLLNYIEHCLLVFRFADIIMQLIKSIYSMEELNMPLRKK